MPTTSLSNPTPISGATLARKKDPFQSPPIIGGQGGPAQLAQAFAAAPGTDNGIRTFGGPAQPGRVSPAIPTQTVGDGPVPGQFATERQPRSVFGKPGQFDSPPLIGRQGSLPSGPQGLQFQQGGQFNPPTPAPRDPLPTFQQPTDSAGNVVSNTFASTPVAAPTVGANQASAQSFNFQSFQPFVDAVLAEQNRTLDPQLKADEAAFRQRLVGQGVQEGTRAFDDAFANFSRAQNDARSSARNQALAQALAVQNQMFGQGLANAQLRQQAELANASNALQAAGLNQQGEQFAANFGLNDRNAVNQFNLARAQLGEGQRQFDQSLGSQNAQFGATFDSRQAELANAFNLARAQFGEGQRQFDANLGLQSQNLDFNQLFQLLGLGQSTVRQNNALQQQDFLRQLQLLGLAPGVGGVGGIDTNAPFAQQLQRQQQQALLNAQANQAGLGALTGLLGAGIGLLS